MQAHCSRRQALTVLVGVLLLAGCGKGTSSDAAAPADPAIGNTAPVPVVTDTARPAALATAAPTDTVPTVVAIATVATTATKRASLLPQLPGPLDVGFGGGTLDAGAEAPAFALPDATGKLVDLASLRGRPTVLNFFATSCGPCAAELPLLAAVQQRYGSALQTVLIGVLAAPGELTTFTTANGGALLPALADQQGTAARAYHVGLVPMTIVLDGNGRVSASLVGELTPSTLTAAVTKAGVVAAGGAVPALPTPVVPAAGPPGCCALPGSA